MKVAKFGGSSVASATQLKKVLDIVKSDSRRKFIIVSAPGKRSAQDIKVTDLLVNYFQAYIHNEPIETHIKKIIARFESILDELNIEKSILSEIKTAITSLSQQPKENNPYLLDSFLASGEDTQAKIVASFFSQNGINASYKNPLELGIIVSSEPGNARILPESYEKISQWKHTDEVLVIPGFFGYTQDGHMCTFSRGGSDISGSIVAAGIQAEIYENFTDVNGIFVAHPKIISQPKTVTELTYREMRELAYAGFAILHDEALMPVYRAKIPVIIKNTNNPQHPGTRITNERALSEDNVVGIASDQGFASIYISKYLMNRELGFGRKLLQILEKFNLSYEHMPSGIDDISIVLREKQLTPTIEAKLLQQIKEILQADEVRITHGLSMIMIVGEGMRKKIGITAESTTALAKNKINLEMINQGCSEVSIMFGINQEQEEAAIKALYQQFFL